MSAVKAKPHTFQEFPMLQSQQRTLDSLRRVQDFIETHAATLGAISTSATRQELTTAIDETSSQHINQGTAHRTLVGEMSRQRVLAQQLVDSHMRPITKFARGKLRGVPDYAALTVRVGAVNVTRLLSAARTMGEVAAKYTSQFASAGLAADTVERLKAATEALAGAKDSRSHAKGVRMASRRAIAAALIRGRDAVRVLDAQISQVLPGNDALLTTWRAVSRVEVKTGKARTVTPATTPSSSSEVKAQA
jgi:hypothetical protein